jgi:hypothetical protein
VTWTISSGTCVAEINASETCKSTVLHEKRAERCTPIRGTDIFDISFSEFCIRNWAWCCFVRRSESTVENRRIGESGVGCYTGLIVIFKFSNNRQL